MTNIKAQPATRRGPAEYFTGTVWMDDVINTPPEMGVGVYRVTFEPSSRTVWHSHPVGQILVVEAGVGRAQIEGEPVQDLLPGDSVYFAPGVRHWHGAAPNRVMIHLAIQRIDETGNNATWMEHVSDEQYGA